jgi:hypothetical protein
MLDVKSAFRTLSRSRFVSALAVVAIALGAAGAIGAIVLAMALQSAPRAVVPAFTFQDNFWVNLHHVLRGEARRRGVGAPARVKLDELTANERVAWTSALDAYAGFASRSLIFDAPLVRISNALTLVAGEASLDPRPASLDQAAARALTMAAPVYRRHYWPAQRELNERWIVGVRAMIAEHGQTMSDALAGAYRVPWPGDPVIVDACAEAGPDGGYTTDGPRGTAAHTVIEAESPQNQGDMAFEMVFHEASHARAIEGHLSTEIKEEAARQHVIAAGDLDHVLIFYTVGALAQRALGKTSDAGYKPYAYRYAVYTRGWQPLRDALERDWKPYLDGGSTFEVAMSALVHDTAGKD